MSVTIHSKGIGIGRLIPRVIYYETEGKYTPVRPLITHSVDTVLSKKRTWNDSSLGSFKDSNVANKACTFNWPGIDCKFNFFLYELYNFHVELEVYGPVRNITSNDTLISNILTASEIITIPTIKAGK